MELCLHFSHELKILRVSYFKEKDSDEGDDDDDDDDGGDCNDDDDDDGDDEDDENDDGDNDDEYDNNCADKDDTIGDKILFFFIVNSSLHFLFLFVGNDPKIENDVTGDHN